MTAFEHVVVALGSSVDQKLGPFIDHHQFLFAVSVFLICV
jgi:hypothetical protein